MTLEEALARIKQLEAEIETLGSKSLADDVEIEGLKDDLDDRPTRADLLDSMTEQECIRCHARFMGLDEQKWCTRDCRYGWTPAPTFEDYYRSLHPTWQGQPTGTNPRLT